MAHVVDMQGLCAEALALMATPGRRFLAIAGAPGSGKSTTAARLHAWLETQRPGESAVLPMDGFHFDDAVLEAMGRRPWKGAPDTFDVGGLHAILRRLRDDHEDRVAVPVFDRDLEISRGSARLIDQRARLVIVEGNYLLLRQSPWDRVQALFDRTVLIEVPEPVLAARLRQRWQSYRLSDIQIQQKLEANDLPNGRLVIARSGVPDLVLREEEEETV
ncbi:nucleoside/nucleotide kinase family protein [Epibacterium sp. MM17-32]|uniref:nucleoside/nucleotide kinase family protein n=1 Tax=Epibacterium sp. MM17-32 TaxID=2917734 RepID=UPI001EF5BD27|nr:nucleoside/nucleotide kinase family protein [Epibacterium sp. MM17-32]MCG7630031.1 nucleoside/nucleotide kinase family protein [Epibacterium sp. MM17-32]